MSQLEIAADYGRTVKAVAIGFSVNKLVKLLAVCCIRELGAT
jgi:hypothetical protein